MLSFFRKNSFINSAMLLPYAFLLQILPILFYKSSNAFWPDAPWSGLTNAIMLIVLLFILAIFINRMVIENRLHRDIMLFPGVFFILYSAILPEFWTNSHILFANVFVVWSIYELFQIYKSNNPAVYIFNAALLVGIASVICPPCIFYLLMLLIGISNLKKTELVHIMQVMIGGIVPWFLLITYHVWRGHPEAIISMISTHVGFSLKQIISDHSTWYKYLSFALLVFFLLLMYNEFKKKKHIQAQKKIDILFVALIFSILVAVFHLPSSPVNLLFAAPFVGIFVGLLFSHFKNTQWPEMIHMLLFFGIIIFQIIVFVKIG